MPELPEIRIYTANLNRIAAGKEVEDLRCYMGADFSYLKGRTVEKVTSYGKGMYFELRGGGNLYVHLMLTGGFVYADKDEYGDIKDKLIALKIDGKYLIVRDENKYAKLGKNITPPSVPEAGGEDFTVGYFLSLAGGRGAIKNVLTNQSLIVGIGNAYADEILYRAGINPFSVTCNIPVEEMKKLFAAVIDVLGEAQAYLEKNHPDMLSGESREFFKVHIRGEKTTPKGESILVKNTAGKKTYYTENQKLY